MTRTHTRCWSTNIRSFNNTDIPTRITDTLVSKSSSRSRMWATSPWRWGLVATTKQMMCWTCLPHLQRCSNSSVLIGQRQRVVAPWKIKIWPKTLTEGIWMFPLPSKYSSNVSRHLHLPKVSGIANENNHKRETRLVPTYWHWGFGWGHVGTWTTRTKLKMSHYICFGTKFWGGML